MSELKRALNDYYGKEISTGDLVAFLELGQEYKYTNEFMFVLLTSALGGHEVPEDWRPLIAEMTGMLPTEWQTPLNRSQLKDIVKSLESEEVVWRREDGVGWSTEKNWDAVIDGKASDAEYLAIFPARTKIDLRIRRTRMRDAAHSCPYWREVCTAADSVGWDYITTCNVANAVTVFGYGWWKCFNELCLVTELDTLLLRVKKLNDVIKTRKVDIGISKWYFVELATLTGYRNPPFPGFDVFKEARELADGGTVTHSLPGISFEDVARKTLRLDPQAVEQLGLKEHVMGARWVTPGASSLGRVEWEVDGDSGHFKARKNNLLFVFEPDELWDMYERWDGQQVNRTIIKSELSKIRLAVASDLFTYFDETWLSHYIGHGYDRWKGGTMAEDLQTQSNRLNEMLTSLSGRVGLPFDYKGFDHQPPKIELQIIMRIILKEARRNVSNTHLAEFDRISDRAIRSFDGAVLITRDGDKKETLKVKGGLMSGLRWTSMIGNAWNSVVTAMVIKWLGKLGLEDVCVNRWIRGDDSAIVCKSWADAYMFRMGYQFAGILAGDGKFSIWREQMEFLRQWFDKRVYAYPTRVLPGWVQQKPWNSEGWDESGVMNALATLRDMLVRRGCGEGVFTMWKTTRDIWCKRTRVDRRWVGLPVALGGLGMEPWTGWIPNHSLPRVGIEGIKTVNLSRYAIDKWNGLAREYGVTLTAEDARELANEDAASTMRGDDVPGVRKVLRDRWREKVRQLKGVKWTKAPPVYPSLWSRSGTDVVNLEARQDALNRLPSEWPYWRSLSRHVIGWRVMSKLERYGGEAPAKWLKRTDPQGFRILKSLEKRGLRRHEALDWLFGELTFPLSSTNPVVGDVVQRASRSAIGDPMKRRWKPHEWGTTIYRYGVETAQELQHSEWYITLFKW